MTDFVNDTTNVMSSISVPLTNYHTVEVNKASSKPNGEISNGKLVL